MDECRAGNSGLPMAKWQAKQMVWQVKIYYYKLSNETMAGQIN